jgi:malonyl-CoA O-methyltransferase
MSAAKAPLVIPAREGYDRWSQIYDSEDNPLIALEQQHIQAALGPVAGLRILDLGCGTGRHTLLLARAGADVTGVDFSAGMLDQARRKPGAERVRFVHHDITARLPFGDGEFDLVLCALALEHVRELGAVFGEMRRLIREPERRRPAGRPAGRIVISEMHPAMWLRGVSAHFHDPETGRDIRPASAGNQISDYVMAAVESGLAIERLAEFSIDEALVARSPRAAKHLGWPLLLLMTLRP